MGSTEMSTAVIWKGQGMEDYEWFYYHLYFSEFYTFSPRIRDCFPTRKNPRCTFSKTTRKKFTDFAQNVRL